MEAIQGDVGFRHAVRFAAREASASLSIGSHCARFYQPRVHSRAFSLILSIICLSRSFVLSLARSRTLLPRLVRTYVCVFVYRVSRSVASCIFATPRERASACEGEAVARGPFYHKEILSISIFTVRGLWKPDCVCHSVCVCVFARAHMCTCVCACDTWRGEVRRANGRKDQKK